MKYYLIDSGHIASLKQTYLWDAIFHSRMICEECRGLLSPGKSMRLHLDTNYESPQGCFGLYDLYAGGPWILNTKIVSKIPVSVLKSQVALGPVFDASDSILNEWISFSPKSEVILRGVREAKLKKCSRCRRSNYSSIDFPGYLRGNPKNGREVFSAQYGLVVSERVLDTAFAPSRLNYRCTVLEVCPKAMDGLPARIPIWNRG